MKRQKSILIATGLIILIMIDVDIQSNIRRDGKALSVWSGKVLMQKVTSKVPHKAFKW